MKCVRSRNLTVLLRVDTSAFWHQLGSFGIFGNVSFLFVSQAKLKEIFVIKITGNIIERT